MQTHTGDYNNAPWPFECVPIGGSQEAIRLQPDGTLVTEDPELQVPALLTTTLISILLSLHRVACQLHATVPGLAIRVVDTRICTAAAAQIVVEGGWRNKIATPVWEGLGVPILRTWNQTVPLWSLHHDYHPNNPHPDCTHSCHPRYVRVPLACH